MAHIKQLQKNREFMKQMKRFYSSGPVFFIKFVLWTKETKETKEKYPTVELSDLQKEIVYEVAELAPQTVVLLNQCEVEDSLMFKKYKQVKRLPL